MLIQIGTKIRKKQQNMGKTQKKNLFVQCARNYFPCFLRPAIHLSRNTQNAKNKKCIAGYFTSLFSHFAPPFSLFAFCCISRQGQHSHKKSKEFVVHFFAELIKHKISMKCERYLESVSYFVVYFAKNTAKCEKHLRKAKCEKLYSRPNVFLCGKILRFRASSHSETQIAKRLGYSATQKTEHIFRATHIGIFE